MSEHVEGLNRDQTLLFPETLEKYVDQDNPVRFIDAFIESLNSEKIGFTHAIPAETGRPSYNPKDLLKLYVYGYLNQVRTSRRLERECHRNIEVIWLMKKLTPDYKTIADFRKDNAAGIKAVFKEFVKLCIGLGLYGKELIAVDGSKFKAVNAKEKHFNQKTLAKRIELIEKSSERYLEALDAADKQEEQNQAKHVWEDKIKELLSKKETCEELLGQMKASGQNEVALTDPQCRLMKTRGGIEPGYNVEAAVDAKNHLIVDYEVTNAQSDNHELCSIAKSAMETFGVERIGAVADNGFFDSLEIKKCVDSGIVPYVAFQRKSTGGHGGVPTPEFSSDKFTYKENADLYVCPAGQKLEFYYSTVIDGKRMRVYRSKADACFSCQFYMTNCTRFKVGRWIRRWEHEWV
ncbi:MAG TPA: IS1182 family transposase, partial [Candidatus Bathyarchaeia archaeon]|nr:IS1182 family transposase [Candidatus Bathyarchaeia archaeon]